MKTPGLFQKFAISTFYKYILYLSGIILILSLFIETRSIDVALVRKYCIKGIVVGLSIWFLSDLVNDIKGLINPEKSDFREKVGVLVFLYYFLTFSITIIIFIM